MANIWYIQVNRYCNNQCHFCSNPDNWESISYDKWIELLDDFKNKKYSWVIFTWGEPTLSKDLSGWIAYSKKIWLWNRIISNWMKCSDYNYIKNLKDSWLELVHFSLYSCYEQVHDFLTDTPWSWKNLIKSITNASKLWIRIQINIVINHYNQNHLDKLVRFLVKYFPNINHFIWNNLDPTMMRKTKTAISTLPNLNILSNYFSKSLEFLENNWKTFRVESIPLCFIKWFEWSSTETRKIVKNEERMIHFLDNRKTVRQYWKYWEYDKLKECKKCDLNSICSWVYEYKRYYNNVKVIPQKLTKIDRENIINKIRN